MQTVTRRASLAFAMLVAFGIVGTSDEADADLLGGDVAVLGDILAQAYIMVSKLKDQLDSLGTQISLMQSMLEKLDPRSFDDIENLLTSNEISYSTLTSGVGAIDFSVAAVNRDFQSLFPADLTTANSANFDSLYLRWQTELLGSAMIAQRAQASLSMLANNTVQANAILARAQSSGGQVAQMQAIVQMLGVMQGESNALVQSTNTAARVSANMAAASAAERILSREKKRRNLQNYTDRGPAGTVLPKLPSPH